MSPRMSPRQVKGTIWLKGLVVRTVGPDWLRSPKRTGRCRALEHSADSSFRFSTRGARLLVRPQDRRCRAFQPCSCPRPNLADARRAGRAAPHHRAAYPPPCRRESNSVYEGRRPASFQPFREFKAGWITTATSPIGRRGVADRPEPLRLFDPRPHEDDPSRCGTVWQPSQNGTPPPASCNETVVDHEGPDPAGVLRVIAGAAKALLDARFDLDAAVDAARLAGCSWRQIGFVAGRPYQTLHRRHRQGGET